MEKRQISLRTLFLIFSGFALPALVLAWAYQGSAWAIGVSTGAAVMLAGALVMLVIGALAHVIISLGFLSWWPVPQTRPDRPLPPTASREGEKK